MREWIFQKPDSFETDAKHDAYCVGEIVRCKDCRYRGKEEYPVCCENADDWYCASGERREP